MANRNIPGHWNIEEQYVLRVRDPELADRIRSALRDEAKAAQTDLQIVFEDHPYHGYLKFEGQQYKLTVLNLPTIVECYKTYDDVNLVKTGDIGQVLVVGDITEQEIQGGECRDGITPPMRNARERVFRKPIQVPPEAIRRVENQLLDVLSVGSIS